MLLALAGAEVFLIEKDYKESCLRSSTWFLDNRSLIKRTITKAAKRTIISSDRPNLNPNITKAKLIVPGG